MNMKSIALVLGIITLTFSGGSFAQTQVPNTVQAGQPARAAEVNENFSTLESVVNQNASDADARLSALEVQVQILFDSLSPPPRRNP